MLNFILGCVWLIAGFALLANDLFTGTTLLRIRGLNLSTGWFLLVLACWNFARWYSARAWRAEQNSLRIAHEARLREARYRERPAEPDPNFDFSDKPAPPPGRGQADQPPSAN